MATWAVDWSGVDFLGDGAGGGAYSNTYKFYGDGNPVNVQQPGTPAPGIYITFADAAFGEVRINGKKADYNPMGAAICLYLSNFDYATETEVNVMNMENTEARWTFYVYNANAFTPEPTEYGIVGDFNSWSADANGVVFNTTLDANVLKATTAEFTTGQWGFKVRKGTGWDNLYGCTNPISTGVAATLDADHNIHIGQEQNNVTLHNVTFTITLDGEGNATTLKVDADENINIADFVDEYMMVGDWQGWKFEDEYHPLKFTYVGENTYTASIDRIQGEWKIVKNNSWTNALGGGGTDLGIGVYNLYKGGDNTAFASGHVIRNATFTLVIANDGNATITVAGTDIEEHSFGLVGVFQGWDAANAPLFEEQADGTFTYDNAAFPGGSMFKVSIDKTWTCFLSQSGVTTLDNGEAYTCAKANNDNNFKIGEEGKTYEAHFVLTPANDGASATLTVVYFEDADYTELTQDTHSVKILAYHMYGTNDYTLKVKSEETIDGLGGSFWHVNGVGTEMRSSMTQVDEHTLAFNVTSTSAPNIYTPLYVMMPGEVNFGTITLNWVEVGTPAFKVTTEDTEFYSLYLDHAVTVPANVTAYTGKIEGETLKLTAVEGTIPANTGVVFKTTEAGVASFKTAADVAAIENNDIKGVAVDTAISSIEVNGGTLLVLGVVNDKVGFALPTTETLAANKAYVVVPASSPAKTLRLVVEGESTGITSAVAESNNAIYNIAGQRVEKAGKGLFIINGKKVLK